tara:strand:- start:984 stop:1658 length:675 start_codon:yes stop_codon:yes gene_type:complete
MITFKQALTIGVTALVLAGCQTSGGSYTMETQRTSPVKSSYSDFNEYVVRLFLHNMPRRCVTITIYGGDINDPKDAQKVRGTFNLWEITQNGYKGQEHWYSSRGAINNTVGKFYINSLDPSQYACGYTNFRKRYLDTGKTQWSAGKTILNTEAITAMTAAFTNKSGQSSSTTSDVSSKSSAVVCAYAVSYSVDPFGWSKHSDVSKYVAEAKSRKLSLADCDKIN